MGGWETQLMMAWSNSSESLTEELVDRDHVCVMKKQINWQSWREPFAPH